MESIIRDVRDIEIGDREAIEHLIGHELGADQRLVIQVLSVDLQRESKIRGQSSAEQKLPDWCDVYEGLSEAEVADLEQSIVRSHETRSLA